MRFLHFRRRELHIITVDFSQDSIIADRCIKFHTFKGELYGIGKPFPVMDVLGLVDRDDTARIDAALEQAIPGAQMTRYNPHGYMDYSVISEYDLFDGPGTYYMRVYAKSAEGEWHVTSDTPMCIIVVDPVEAGFLNSYN